MNLTNAAMLARELMNKHGLGYIPFEFDRGRRRVGACHFIGGKIVVKITLSQHYVELLPEHEIREVILHEIAHALTPGHHHDSVWQAKARSLGIPGNRCADVSARPEASWKAHCGRCGYVSPNGQHRAPLRVRSCSVCGDGKFNSNFLLEWRKAGKTIPVDQMPVRYRTEHQSMLNRKVIR